MYLIHWGRLPWSFLTFSKEYSEPFFLLQFFFATTLALRRWYYIFLAIFFLTFNLHRHTQTACCWESGGMYYFWSHKLILEDLNDYIISSVPSILPNILFKRSVSIIFFNRHSFFRNFCLIQKYKFRHQLWPRFYTYNETKIFFCLLMLSYNSPRARYLIRKFWENRGHAKLLNREIKTCILKVFSWNSCHYTNLKTWAYLKWKIRLFYGF